MPDPMEVHQLKRYVRPGDDEVKIIDALIEDAQLCPCPAHIDTIEVLRRYRLILVRQHTGGKR